MPRKPKKSRKPAKRARVPARYRSLRKGHKVKLTKTGHSSRTAGRGPAALEKLVEAYREGVAKKAKDSARRARRVAKRVRQQTREYIERYYFSWMPGREGKAPDRDELRALMSRVTPGGAIRHKVVADYVRGFVLKNLGTDAKPKWRWIPPDHGKPLTKRAFQTRMNKAEREARIAFIRDATGCSKRDAEKLAAMLGTGRESPFERTPKRGEKQDEAAAFAEAGSAPDEE